jgi:osmotically-inducible protein OsmY
MKGKSMYKLNPLRTALVLFAGLFLCGAVVETCVGLAETPSATPSPKPAQNNCQSTTDEEIVAAIHEKIKADKRFDGQWRHINVSSLNRAVTIRGWVKGRVQANDLVKYVRTTRCVRRVISKSLRTFRSTTGCAPGQKRCGDLCIDRYEACNLIQ